MLYEWQTGCHEVGYGDGSKLTPKKVGERSPVLPYGSSCESQNQKLLIMQNSRPQGSYHAELQSIAVNAVNAVLARENHELTYDNKAQPQPLQQPARQ